MILQEIVSLISGFKRVYQKDFHTRNETWSVRDDRSIFDLVNIFGFRFINCRADQKQAKNENFYITFFGGDATICICPLPSMSPFVTSFG